MKKTFAKGNYVSVFTAETRTAIVGYVDGIKNERNGDTLIKVNGNWYFEKNVKHQAPRWWTPTDSQMKTIKKEYPFLKKGKVKVIYECGHDTEEGFVGIFGFIWENANQSGKIMFKKGEFTPMKDEFARKYGF